MFDIKEFIGKNLHTTNLILMFLNIVDRDYSFRSRKIQILQSIMGEFSIRVQKDTKAYKPINIT